jgi:branched-chain amino acid transport system permease protein
MLKTLILYFFQGATYGILAVGLVVVYRGTRVFNFAQAEFGTVAAYFTYLLFERLHWPYVVSAVLAVMGVVAIGLVAERLVLRPLSSAPRVTVTLAVAALALLLISSEVVVAKVEPRVLHPAVPGSPLIVFGAQVLPQQLLILGVFALLAAGVVAVSRTEAGLALAALSPTGMGQRVVGIGGPAASRVVWGTAALLGALAGLLQAPVSVFAPGSMTALPGAALIPAFTAAVIGGLNSPLGALIGGEVVGLAQGFGVHFLGTHVPGTEDFTVFVVLVAALLFRPQGVFGRQVA